MLALFLGIVIGFALTITVLALIGNNMEKKEKDDKGTLDNAIANIEMVGSIKYRFAQAQQITERQLDLISQTERPSASAAHSRHKNDIIRQLKELESEKVTIFRSILKDGVDPQLTLMVDGVPTNIKMSEAIFMHDNNGQLPTPVNTETKIPRNGLRLVKTKVENGDESSGSTVPGAGS